ncbi:MAG TPA: hypothetical protein VHX88_16975 [Solirubrobacteraceae bacterium]|nr:hypothetical protein [Solirubrobacteraceae bacterium]
MGGPALTRRRLVLGGAAGALSLSLSACGAPSDKTIEHETKLEPTDDDEILYGGALVAEEVLATYAVALPHLRGTQRALAERLQAQDQEHVTRLDQQLGAQFGHLLGAAARARQPVSPTPPHDADSALALLVQAEDLAIAYWIDSVPKLDRNLRSLPAAIAVNDAQHLALWRAQLRLPALSSALVEGSTT